MFDCKARRRRGREKMGLTEVVVTSGTLGVEGGSHWFTAAPYASSVGAGGFFGRFSLGYSQRMFGRRKVNRVRQTH